jgi:hypothetical protein
MNLIEPELSGMEAPRRVVAEAEATWITLMALHDDPEYRHAAKAAGAHRLHLTAEFGTRLVPFTRSLTTPS